MATTYHILNGDALRERFPRSITGVRIVAREALVDGPVAAATLPDFWRLRAAFLSTSYGGTIDDYLSNTRAEFEKIRQIPPRSSINLWFEDDLFCQVNCWFVAYLIRKWVTQPSVFLVRPAVHTAYGFGGLDEAALQDRYQQSIPVADLEAFAELWQHYQQHDDKALFRLAQRLVPAYPFILPAVQAHLDRRPAADTPGRPRAALLAIIEELGTDAFGPVFSTFCQRESIYGFGDLQVKRIFDDIINHHKNNDHD